MTDWSEEDWWVRAIRAHEKEYGPSGGAWNISMILQRLHSAYYQETKTIDMGFRCPRCDGSRVKLHKEIALSSPPQNCWTCLDCNHDYVAQISKQKP